MEEAIFVIACFKNLTLLLMDLFGWDVMVSYYNEIWDNYTSGAGLSKYINILWPALQVQVFQNISTSCDLPYSFAGSSIFDRK